MNTNPDYQITLMFPRSLSVQNFGKQKLWLNSSALQWRCWLETRGNEPHWKKSDPSSVTFTENLTSASWQSVLRQIQTVTLLFSWSPGWSWRSGRVQTATSCFGVGWGQQAAGCDTWRCGCAWWRRTALCLQSTSEISPKEAKSSNKQKWLKKHAVGCDAERGQVC